MQLFYVVGLSHKHQGENRLGRFDYVGTLHVLRQDNMFMNSLVV